MLRKLSYALAVAAFIGMVGLVGAQVTGTKSAPSAVVSPTAKVKPPTMEERVTELAKGHDKILADLKNVKANQAKILAELKDIKATLAEILRLSKVIFNRMDRR